MAKRDQPEAPIELGFPLHGKVENVPYEKQPPLSSVDMLNCVPFDVEEERARGGIRQGTQKYIDTAINGTTHIQNITQATKVVPALGVVKTDQRWSDTFTAADSTEIANGEYGDRDDEEALGTSANALDTAVAAGSALWIVSSNQAIVDYTGQTVDNTKNRADALVKSGGYVYRYTNTDQDKFVLKVDVTTATGWDTDTRARMGVFFYGYLTDNEYVFAGWDKPDGVDTHEFTVVYRKDGTDTELVTTSATYTVDTSQHTLEVRVNGDFIEVFWDDVRVLVYSMDGDLTGFDTNNRNVGIMQSRFREAVSGNHPDRTNRGSYDNFEIWDAAVPSVLRESRLVVVSDGDPFAGDKSGVTVITQGTGGTAPPDPPLDAGTHLIETAFAYQNVYFCDGYNYLKWDMSGSTITIWQADGTDTLPGGDGVGTLDDPPVDRCRLIRLWEGRIVLSGKADAPSNIWFSRVGDGDNWDYTDTSMAAAVELGASPLGQIGDVITCLASYRGRQLLIGGQKSIWSLTGNPGPDGDAELHSLTPDESIGIVGPRAWCMGRDRTFYFMSQDGFYSLGPNQFAIDKSNRVSAGRLDKTFSAIDYTKNQAQLVWNVDRHGVDVYITPIVEGETIHYFFDQRTGGFYPLQYPKAQGPTAILAFDADAPNDRTLLLGGFDGFVRELSRDAYTDDGTTINAHCMLGPVLSPWVGSEFLFRKLKATLGEESSSLQYEVRTGDTAQSAKDATASYSGSLSAGLNPTVTARARGSAVYVRLSSSGTEPWSLEKIAATLVRAGPVRAR
jgi:hypothetical protein